MKIQSPRTKRVACVEAILNKRSWYNNLDEWQERGVPILRNVQCYLSIQQNASGKKLHTTDWLCWHDLIRIQAILQEDDVFYVADTTRDGSHCANIVLIATKREILVSHELLQGNEAFLAHASFELAGGQYHHNDFIGWCIAPLMRRGRI